MSKNERKIIRKQKRLQHMLIADCGITPSDHPEKNFAVCNAGLATELNEEDLLLACKKYGNVDRIIMLPGKSYCFVVFKDIESAKEAYSNMHGATKLAQGGCPVYLSFISTVPSVGSDDQQNPPEGLKIIENFVNEQEEAMLLSCIDWDDETSGNMKHRRVIHYGYEFMYTNNNIDLNKPLDLEIPSQCNFLWDRLKMFDCGVDTPSNQLTVNQYSPGQGIPSHVDTHSAFLSPILSLSLGADAVMDFKLDKKKYNVLLPSRSLLIMDGPARYEWSHGIAPRAYDLLDGHTRPRGQRTSFTFRWVRPDAKCRCHFPLQCDTFAAENSAKNSKMGNDLAEVIERQHVHQVYDKIASHFNETRTKIWTSVKDFISDLPQGTVLVDIGCGNGKNLRIRKDITQLGVEYNRTLAEVAMYGENNENSNFNDTQDVKISKNEVAQADCLALPLRSECADAAISIAVFHHLATQERRIRAIKEVIRILKPGGQALITVWARDQARGEKTSYLKQNRKNRRENEQATETNNLTMEEIIDENGKSFNLSLPVHVNRSQFQYQDLLVPWKVKTKNEVKKESVDTKSINDNTFMRYYHVFEEGELESVCKLVQHTKVVKNFYEQGNWCVILKKDSL